MVFDKSRTVILYAGQYLGLSGNLDREQTYLSSLIKNGKTIASHKYDTTAAATFSICRGILDIRANIFRQANELVDVAFCGLWVNSQRW